MVKTAPNHCEGSSDTGVGRQGKAPACRWREMRIDLFRLKKMCHDVHMETISLRELHLKTGRWVRHAASRGPIVVTDRGRRVAALQPFDASVTLRPLPNREAAIRKRSKVPVDSAVYQSELCEDGRSTSTRRTLRSATSRSMALKRSIRTTTTCSRPRRIST